jgi:hypothetical protein
MPAAPGAYTVPTDGKGASTGYVSFAILWLRISLHQAGLAEQDQLTEDKALAVKRALEDGGGPLPAEGEPNEMDASMVALAAAAFAIDAFYGALRPIVKPPRSNASRDKQVFELLKHGFKVGREQRHWESQLKWLFAERDRCVHHSEKPRPLVPRVSPAEVVMMVVPEALNFSAANARKAADIVAEIFDYCFANPKPVTATWTERRKDGFARMIADA